MEKLGFHPRWQNLMMQYISLVTYSIRINGKLWDHITLSRGLRQSDLLSPYLFLLCAEGLSALIKKAISDRVMEGVSMCRGAPILSYLVFADDSIISIKLPLRIVTLYSVF